MLLFYSSEIFKYTWNVMKNMAIVIHPKEEEEIYLDSLVEVLRKKGIRGSRIEKDVELKIYNFNFHFKKGDYVIFYGNKKEVVEKIGSYLKERGYEVGFFDEILLATLKFLQNVKQV